MRFNLTTPWGRALAYLDFLLGDHAFLRLMFQNVEPVGPAMIRSDQPWPFQLRTWRDRGVKTILNLRGATPTTQYDLEEKACRRLGLTLVNLRVYSREAPSREMVAELRRIFDTIEYPCLMHCKSGADRVGVVSALYANMKLGQPMGQALKQLSLRHGHFRQGKTGILDFALEHYARDGGGLTYEQWVTRPDYDPAAIKAEFKSRFWGRLFTEGALARE